MNFEEIAETNVLELKVVKLDVVKDSDKRIMKKVRKVFPGYKKGCNVIFHRCVTTNAVVKGDTPGQRRLVMGRGCAKDLKVMYPSMANYLGDLVADFGGIVHLLPGNFVSFPTKNHWKNPSDQCFIGRNFEKLLELALDLNARDNCVTLRRWHTFLLPLPGCGSGGLDWVNMRHYLSIIAWQFYRGHVNIWRSPNVVSELARGKEFIIFVDKE